MIFWGKCCNICNICNIPVIGINDYLKGIQFIFVYESKSLSYTKANHFRIQKQSIRKLFKTPTNTN